MRHPAEFTDTDPRALEVWLEVLRGMTPGERLGATFKASEFVLQSWVSEIRSSFPDAEEAEVRLRVAARHLPRELMIQVYEWDPALHGINAPSENPLGELPFGGHRVDMAYVRKWAAYCGMTTPFEQLLQNPSQNRP
jgi:hypothetical protein